MKTLNLVTGMVICFAGLSMAQAPAAKGKAAPAAAKGAATGASTPAAMGQLMKGIFYPASNVIFAAQSEDPTKLPPAKDSSTSPNPLTSAYGKWEAVENAGLAMAEASVLLTNPNRKCTNGRPVPVRNADWAKLVADVRAAGIAAYNAAKTKDQDKVVDAADVMTTACSNCHDKYREVADRCK